MNALIKLFVIASVAIAQGNANGNEVLIKGRNIFEQYTLGQETEGAKLLYSYQNTDSYDEIQDEIIAEIDYPVPDANPDRNSIITQLKLYVETGDDAVTQAYVTHGGIGQSSISLRLEANNTETLHYMILINGVAI